jgi:hypothetical protein
MALMDQDHVAAATNGGGLLLKLGLEGVKEIRGGLWGVPRLRAATSEGSVEANVEALQPGDRLILASPSLAAALTQEDFDDRQLRCASPKRLANLLLELARDRGLKSASVITSSLATRVQPVWSREVAASTESAHAIQSRFEPARTAFAAAS